MAGGRKRGANPDLSIIIVSWNVRRLLEECLKSLYDSINGLTFEVFVVDNASSDQSVEMVRSKFRDVCLIANSENVGFGRANNQALEMSRGKYVLFLNPDALVLKGCVEELVDFLERHPTVGMSGRSSSMAGISCCSTGAVSRSGASPNSSSSVWSRRSLGPTLWSCLKLLGL